MSIYIRLTPRILLASTLISAALTLPAAADFVGVSRCNAASQGYPPVLHFVNGGNRFTVGVDERGLTADIIYNEAAALAWARQSGLFPEGTVFGNYQNYICGLQYEETQTEPEPETAPPLPPPPPEECQDEGCIIQ